MDCARAGSGVRVTPPFKPYMEEKMWFALFWLRPLREFWRRELGERHWLKLQKVIPRTWIMDPAPLPHHAVIAGLEINDWRELGTFSQKQRDLILKISGYSELAWGSRGSIWRRICRISNGNAPSTAPWNVLHQPDASCSVFTKAGWSNIPTSTHPAARS